MKRGAVKKKAGSRPVVIWFPDALVDGMDEGVRRVDSDRSKLIRQAVREKLERIGIPVK